MAAEHHFVYTGGGSAVVPRHATHVTIHDSITVIPERLFHYHPSIIELICHEGVIRIEDNAFYACRRLKRVIIPGVKIIIGGAFGFCTALTYIECPKLERIGISAFHSCYSLRSIKLQSVKVVGAGAFMESALTDVVFRNDLESVGSGAFKFCRSLERITFPLKEDIITSDIVFQACDKLSQVDLVEIEVLNKTIDALLIDNWRDDMSDELNSINQSLPNANPGSINYNVANYEGDKSRVIREWIGRVLHKIVDYKVQHRRILDESAALLRLSLPNDIVTKNIRSFLELPPHTFEGEIDVEDTDGMPE